jgi:hypothetical protein
MSGDTIIVGAFGSYAGGSAYIFVFNGERWIEQVKLKPADSTEDDCFGCSVSLNEDTALVGAYNSAEGTGAVYVFVRNAFGYWSQQARLTAENGVPGERFGFDVGLSGDRAIIGTHSDQQGNANAYIFLRSGTNWNQQTKLAIEGGAGNPVSIWGETAVVGAYHRNNTAGAADVFVYSGTVWEWQAELTAPDGVAGDWFGSKLSLSGDTALIGAYRQNAGSGAAYIFERGPAGWSNQAKLTAAGAPGDFFGFALSVGNGTALVGAYHNNQDAGAVYFSSQNGSAWSEPERVVTGDSSMLRDSLGYSVSTDRGTTVMGAPTRQDKGMVLVRPDRSLTASSVIPAESRPASEVTAIGAVLNANLVTIGDAGSVSVCFEYGATSSYSNTSLLYSQRTPAQVLSASGVFSAPVTKLNAGTTYHFRARVDAGPGGVSYGPDLVFTTDTAPYSSPLPVVQPPASIAEMPPAYRWLAANIRVIMTAMVISLAVWVLILRHRADMRLGAAVAAPRRKTEGLPDYDRVLKRMEELVQQRKDGVISDSEFDRQKTEIFSQIPKKK